MVDTIRTLTALTTNLPDNTSGLILPQNIRDLLVSLAGGLVNGATATSGSSLTFATNQNLLIINKTTGSATGVTLPSAVAFTTFVIKDGKGDATINNITVTPSSGTIDGASSFIINVNYQSVTVIFDGTNWHII